MTAIVYYLLKVVLCSGILFLYYRLALRNRMFHRWNRFYLLFVIVLSLVLPLLQFRFTADESNTADAWQLLQSLQKADNTLEEFIVVGSSSSAPELLLMLSFGLISLVLLTRLLLSIRKVLKIIHTHNVRLVNGVKFINTSIQGTPFSFFEYIFWNKDISLKTITGQQIFQHERVHVEEKHTVDKIFLQVVLVAFWCNPFFWLIRKELHYIHEFIADQKAIETNDEKAFAAMILQAAYPTQYASVINPFFQTSIKRRIVMLTKKQKPGVQYISRVLALPLIATTILAFTIRTEAATDLDVNRDVNHQQINVSVKRQIDQQVADTVPKNQKEIRSVDVKKNPDKKVSQITLTYTDGSRETMTGAEAEKRGLITKSGQASTVQRSEKVDWQEKTSIRKVGEDDKQPLIILDGKEISKEEMNKIDPNTIESINVLKDKHASEKYGEKGKNGVVEITSKKSTNSTTLNPRPGFEKTETPASVDKQK